MKITVAALKKVISETTFEEGAKHVNENALADLYGLMQHGGKDLAGRLKKAARGRDPRSEQVNQQAKELIATLHAIMNAGTLTESKNVRSPVAQLVKILTEHDIMNRVSLAKTNKSPHVIAVLKQAAALNHTLGHFTGGPAHNYQASDALPPETKQAWLASFMDDMSR